MAYKRYRVVFHVTEAYEVYVKARNEDEAIIKAEKKRDECELEHIDTVDYEMVDVHIQKGE